MYSTTCFVAWYFLGILCETVFLVILLDILSIVLVVSYILSIFRVCMFIFGIFGYIFRILEEHPVIII